MVETCDQKQPENIIGTDTTTTTTTIAKSLDLKKNPLLTTILIGCETLKHLCSKKLLPLDHLDNAKALLILRTGKVGFLCSFTRGYGLLIRRDPASNLGWSPPLPLKLDGFSVGALAGYSEQHIILTLSADSDVQAFIESKRAMKIGLDFALQIMSSLAKSSHASAQPIPTKIDSKSGTRAFVLSKGIMIDASLHGFGVEQDKREIVSVYGEGVTASNILTGNVPAPSEATLLYTALSDVKTTLLPL